jgi:hypothetical protein
MPNILPPQPLNMDDLNSIAENDSMLACYDQSDKFFWRDLKANSVEYLQRNEYFKNEGKYFHIFCKN